jgi:hypothetical protein
MATKRQEYDRKRYEIKQLKEGVNPRKYKTGELDKQLENAKQIFIEMERNEKVSSQTFRNELPLESIDFDVINDNEFHGNYSLGELSNMGLDNAIQYLRQTVKNYGVEPDDVNQATQQIHDFMSQYDETDYDKIYKCEIVCIYLVLNMIKEGVELTPSTISYFLKVYLKTRTPRRF